jgi:hypothetical protein
MKHVLFALVFLLAASLFAQEFVAQAYKAPESNAKFIPATKPTQYFTIDTTVIFTVHIHLNNTTLLQFPTRVKLVVLGNSAEIKTQVEGKDVYIKPLLGETNSNIFVTLYSGDIIAINLEAVKDHKDRTMRAVFIYPDFNPYQEIGNSVKEMYDKKARSDIEQITASLVDRIPGQTVQNLMVYRITDDRDETSLKYQGYVVKFDHMVSDEKHTYFCFSTNAKRNEKCPITSISKIEIKSKARDRSPIELDEYMNTADRFIVRTPKLSDSYEKMKLYITLKFYEVEKTLKVVAE